MFDIIITGVAIVVIVGGLYLSNRLRWEVLWKDKFKQETMDRYFAEKFPKKGGE